VCVPCPAQVPSSLYAAVHTFYSRECHRWNRKLTVILKCLEDGLGILLPVASGRLLVTGTGHGLKRNEMGPVEKCNWQIVVGKQSSKL